MARASFILNAADTNGQQRDIDELVENDSDISIYHALTTKISELYLKRDLAEDNQDELGYITIDRRIRHFTVILNQIKYN